MNATLCEFALQQVFISTRLYSLLPLLLLLLLLLVLLLLLLLLLPLVDWSRHTEEFCRGITYH